MTNRVTKQLRARAVWLAASLGLIGLAAAQANAGCLDSALRQVAPTKSSSPNYFVPAVYRPGASDASLIQVGDWGDNSSIVGLWEFQLGGFLQDFGTQAFHEGGTEMMFSAGVDPATGDVCQGVWRKVGRSTYTLNHIALAWVAPGAGYGLMIRIHMVIKLDHSGNSFTGTYTVGVFPEGDPQHPFDESGGPVASGTGTLTATRVKPD
jgi:hypothetical protein